MSKKLIAIASAAALALSALVAVPSVAAAGPFEVTETSPGTGATASSALEVVLASADTLRTDDGTLIEIQVQTTTNTAGVVVTGTGAIRVLTQAEFDDLDAAGTVRTSKGASSANQAAVGGNAIFYVFTTSTAAGTITVSQSGTTNSKTLFVKGVDPVAYNLVLVKAPTFVGVGQDAEIAYRVTDAFGNALEDSASDFVLAVDKVGPITVTAAGDKDWDAGNKYYVETITGVSPGGNSSVQLTLTADKVDTLGTPKKLIFANFSGGDLSAQVTALTAQVAALTADYNALAKRWNKRVADKKAPKKKVALK